MISGNIFRIAKLGVNDDSANDKNGGGGSSDQSMTNYERNQMSKPTISYEGGYHVN